ncbi:MAG: competence/damage-inducible protein A [Vulcanimicrobiaceae bacterium]
MARVELLAVGTELLLGQLVDTNTAYVAGHLAQAGIDVYGARAVGDNRERIAFAVTEALGRADGLISTGGLGPTVDDLTKEAVCDALGLRTELYAPALETLERAFAALGRPMRENNRKQAMLPAGSTALENANGTAPGFLVFRDDGKFVACMPGVPAEMKPMLTGELIPRLRERLGLSDAIFTRIVHTVNVAESEIDHRIEDLFRSSENPKVAVLAHGGRCDVKIMAKAPSRERAEAMIAPLQAEVEEKLEGFVFGLDAETLEAAIHRLLQSAGLTCAVAESCTGGRIAAALTTVPGSSRSFLGGIVAYDNAVKIGQLGVSPATLNAFGAVSEEVACEMARGACERLGSSVAVATTGVAGPDGGSDDKPVGLVSIAVAWKDGSARARSIRWRGDRELVQSRATASALGMLWNSLIKR